MERERERESKRVMLNKNGIYNENLDHFSFLLKMKRSSC